MVSKVISIKLLKSGVEVCYTERHMNADNITVESDIKSKLLVEPHEDLKAAMARLSPHFANLTEYEDFTLAEVKKRATIEVTSAQLPVRQLHWKTGRNWNGCYMHGHRLLTNGLKAPIGTNPVKFSNPAEQYELVDHLEEVVDKVREEVVLLLDGKFTPPAQTSITDANQQEPEDEEEEA